LVCVFGEEKSASKPANLWILGNIVPRQKSILVIWMEIRGLGKACNHSNVEKCNWMHVELCGMQLLLLVNYDIIYSSTSLHTTSLNTTLWSLWMSFSTQFSSDDCY
jgi:hypothetical protein